MIVKRVDGEPLEVFVRRVAALNQTVEVGTPRAADDVRTAWGEWLGGFPWDAWGTLTFRWADPTHAQLDRAFGRFITTVRMWADDEAPYFLGHEVGAGGRAHLHCLIGGLRGWDGAQRSRLWGWWFKRYGRCEVRGYDPEKGAAHYVSKYITKALAHYDVDLGRWTQWHQPTNGSPSWKRRRGPRA